MHAAFDSVSQLTVEKGASLLGVPIKIRHAMLSMSRSTSVTLTIIEVSGARISSEAVPMQKGERAGSAGGGWRWNAALEFLIRDMERETEREEVRW